jgi:SAM-dependent methyltransferase
MPVGSEINCNGRDPIRRAVAMLLGTPDLHSHIRVSPMIKHLPPLLPSGPARIIECGCGNGMNLFELAKINKNIATEGYDLNEGAIASANRVKREFFLDRSLAFHCADATQLADAPGSCDCVLLIDILEHIDDDRALAAWATNSLKDGGLLCVSVPTPRYKQIFGEEFHNAVGHVREGYNASELKAILPDLELVGLWFNTGLISQIGCWFYYRYGRKLQFKVIGVVVALVCKVLFAWADFPNGPKLSCSLFAIFRKPPVA